MTFDPTGAATSNVAPVCPRHPREISYVRCQRCDRPVCPACQRPAPVGVQCVDCVREGSRSVRAPRTMFGGRVGSGRPVVTLTLIALCVVVYLFQWRGGEQVTDRFSFVPEMAKAQPYRFLTAAFLHDPSFVLHLIMNMYALWIMGPYLEGLLGRSRFAALYLVSALGGQVGYFVMISPSWNPGADWNNESLGASGAVFGLFAAALVVNRKLGRDTLPLVGVLVLNLVLGFNGSWHIAWQAHVGGLVTGGLIGLGLVSPVMAGRTGRQVAGMTALVVVLVAVAVLKMSTVPAGLLS